MKKKINMNGDTISLNDRGEGWVAAIKPGSKSILEGEQNTVNPKATYYNVYGTYPGDMIEFQIGYSKRKRRRNIGYLQKIIVPGYERVPPPCSHYQFCGGCNRQDLKYEDQVKLKNDLVTTLLSDLVNQATLEQIKPIITSEEFNYRNRMDYFFGSNKWLIRKEGVPLEPLVKTNEMRGAGLHMRGLYDRVIDIETCHLQNKNEIRNTVHQWGLANKVEYYNSRSQTGWLKGLTIRTTLTQQILIIIEVTDDQPTLFDSLIEQLKENHSEISSCYQVINSEKKESCSNLPHQLIYGEEAIIEKCNHLQLKIYPQVFYQTNSKQAEKLYTIVKEKAELTGKENILDLYCGIGSIGLYLANDAKSVLGVEMVEASVITARENAELNQIKNARFEAIAAEKLATDETYDVIIVDPPRAGLHPKVIDFLKQANAKRIIYVSCNPFTLTRDLEELRSHYRLIDWQTVDMFPQTHHVETVATLIAKNLI